MEVSCGEAACSSSCAAGTHPGARQVEGRGARARCGGARRRGALGTARRRAEGEQNEGEEEEEEERRHCPTAPAAGGWEFGKKKAS